jgi:acyl-CoA thioesterase YciA
MLAWLDEAGGIMASHVCCTPNMITLKIDEVLFKLPVKVNQHIRIYGNVMGIGRTSISLYLEARRFLFESHSEEVVCSTKAIYVRIDSEGRSAVIDRDIIEKYKSLNP